MKMLFYVLTCFLLLSCQVDKKSKVVDVSVSGKMTKLERLYLLSHDSILQSYDLSNDSITHFPNLSKYTINNLDLSGNLLDTLIIDFLPKKLERLNLSYNYYKGKVKIYENTLPDLKELDISHNELEVIVIFEPLQRIILSYNNFGIISLNHEHLHYLDVSYNSRLTQEVSFEPTQIDTVVREGVAEGKRLYGPISIWSIKAIE